MNCLKYLNETNVELVFIELRHEILRIFRQD